MARATYEVAFDLDGDDVFETVVTSDVIPAGREPRGKFVTTDRGQDQTRPLAPPRAGSASLTLKNDSGDYDAGGTLQAGREVRVRATYSAVTYDLFRGVLSQPKQSPVGTRPQVEVTALGSLSRLARRKVSTALYSNITTDVAIGHLLDAAGFPAALRDLDTGLTTLDWWWLDDEDAMQAIAALKATEGPGAAIYEDGTGAIVFKNRNARVLDARSSTVQTTFRSTAGGTEPLLSGQTDYDPGIKDVVNICTLEVKSRAAQTLGQVWALGSTITLGAGETRTYAARQSSGDPFTAAVAPSSAAGDYTVSAGSLTTTPTIDRTSGASVTITVGPAGVGGATITGLRLRAQSVAVTTATVVTNTVDTSVSRAQYGDRTFPLPIRAEIDVDVAQDFANAVVGFYQDGRPTAQVTLRANHADARMTAALTREVGDRVRLIQGALDTEMHVEQVRHEISAPSVHTTTLALEAADGSTYFVLDESLLDSDDVLGW